MMMQHSTLRHETFNDESIAGIFSYAICLFESPFNEMGLPINFSIESRYARMNGGSYIGMKQVKWYNRIVFRLEGFRDCERLAGFPCSILESNLTIKGVRST